MTDREIMQQALDALNTCDWDYDSDESPHKTFDEDLVNAAAAALKAELAEPERECDVHECRRKVREVDGDIKRKFWGEK